MAMKMKSDLPMLKFTCPKCGNRKYSIKEIRVAYNVFTQLFDIQSARYTAIVCDKCSFTEFYNVPVKKINGVFDFFVGG